MAVKEIKIPDIGDAENVEVIELCIGPGDTVEVDDSLIVIESDKASMDVPSTVAGTVESVAVAVGDTVTEGQVIASIETSETAGADEAEAPAAPSKEAPRAESGADSAEAEAPAEQESEAAEAERGERAEAKDGGGETVREVRVPDIGEAEDVVVIEVAVAAGDEVAENDLLVVIESDKASMEIPAPFGGRVEEVAVSEGDSVTDGTLLVTLAVSGAKAEEPAPETKAPSATQEEAPAAKKKAPSAKKEEPSAKKEEPPAADKQREPAAKAKEETPRERARVQGEAIPAPPPPDERQGEAPPSPGARIYAGPAVRRLARELGVELGEVRGSGDRGRIVKDDVKRHVKGAMQRGPSAAGGIPPIPEVDFSRFGEVETVPMSRVRVKGAANLHRSWVNVPHVTQHDEADVTELEAFRRSLKPEAEAAGVKLTPLPFVIKAVAAVLAEFPTFNASIAPDGKHFVLKKYYHIGMAVDTPDGLVVPVARDVDRKGVLALAGEIAELAGKARAGKLVPDEMRGASFSLSSLGNIGGTGFTPIINAPEVAILGVSKLATKPIWNGEAFEPRQMLPLSLSYDHRAINGAEAGRFMTALTAILADLRRTLL